MRTTMPGVTAVEARAIRGLGSVFLLTAFLANPWLLAHFKQNGAIATGLALFIVLFDLILLFLGAAFLFGKRKSTIFRSVLVAVSISVSLLAVVSGSELYLATRTPAAGPYEAFRVQHLHPFYFFSLPSKPEQLARINTAVVSVNPEGFRGAGPEQKGNRKLAFIIGGSAAFGDGASSDSTTISAYLNALQQEYYFVNAGVPSWNSTQEFYRVAIQLLPYKPDLIVVYDGFNDAATNHGYRYDAMSLPPGTPESYGDMARWVDDIRNRSDESLIKFNFTRLYDLTFPRTRTYLSRVLGNREVGAKNPRASMGFSDDAIHNDVASYLWNLGNMQRLAAARGTRLIVFWQAAFPLHHTATAVQKQALMEGNPAFIQYLQRFHEDVLDNRDQQMQFYDLSDVFDRNSSETPLTEVFLDSVHLTDKGNRIVAGEIWTRISAPAEQ